MSKLKQASLVLIATFTIGGTFTIVPPKTASASRTWVWIAPSHGKRYHYTRGCRGLNNAGHKRHVTLHWAKSHHYRLCGWEK